MLLNPFSKNFILVPVLLNVLVLFYNIIPDIGWVIIILTILIRLALAPSFHSSLKSQAAMTSLQPKMNEIREKHKDDQQAQAKAMMDLYKEHKINPFSSCLPLLIQLPILISLYFVFTKALTGNLDGLYSFVHRPEHLNPMFLKVLDLSKPSHGLAILAGLSQFWQSKLMTPKNTGGAQDATQKIMSMQMTYMLPVVSVVIAWKFPAGLPLYWVVTTLFGIAQQYFVKRKQQPGGQ
ncbi:MAG: YidC/Oxa1 family membrane protein insertase [Candidatus Doudnabacteria bacterium]|nr:YidC/Oxa1 family membrane protein insertase [Candidatus Doudnabacteria bacterium]